MTKQQIVSEVKDLQRALNEFGANPPLKVDGIPGPKTLQALAAAMAKETAKFDGKLMHPIDLCRTKLGLKEIPGKLNNPEIQEMLEACDNIGGRKDKKVHPDEIPWCSALLNWLAEQCGMEKTNNALASSWDKYGESCGDWVEEGDIVTIAHPGRHVTLANKRFNRKTAKTFEGLGGNQGNRIKVSTYSCADIKAARKWKPLEGNTMPPVKSKSTSNGKPTTGESTR